MTGIVEKINSSNLSTMETGKDEEIAKLRQQLLDKELECSTIQESFDEFSESSKELEDELEKELQNAEAKNSSLMTKMHKIQSDYESTSSKFSEASAQISTLQRELELERTSQTKLAAMKRKLEQETDELNTKVRILEATEINLNNQLEEAIEQKVFLLSDHEELVSERQLVEERLRSEIVDLQSEMIALRQIRTDSTDVNVSTASERNSLSDSTERELNDCKMQIASLEEEVDSMSKRIIEMESNNEELKDQIVELQDRLSMSEAMEIEMNEMTDELIEKSQLIQALSKKMEDLSDSLSTAQNNVVVKEDEIFGLNEKCRTLSSELDQKKKLLISSEKRSLELVSEVDAQKCSSCEQLLQELEIVKEEVREISLKESNLQELSKENKCRAEEFQNRVQELQKEVSLRTVKLKDTEEKLKVAISSQNKASIEDCTDLKPISVGAVELPKDSNSLLETFKKELRISHKRNAELLSRIQNITGSIQVFCRIRGFSDEECDISEESISVKEINNSDILLLDRSIGNVNNSETWKSFVFDRSIGSNGSQSEVFAEVEPIALSVVDGFKACIFAYGQTGSGKTFTMEGTDKNPGINKRVAERIFESINTRGLIVSQFPEDSFFDGNNNSNVSYVYTVSAAMFEIYNESIRDLLVEAKSTYAEKIPEIRCNEKGEVVVTNLKWSPVVTPYDLLELFKTGNKNRATSSTSIHSQSSRSHSIVLIRVARMGRDKIVSEGLLYLIDLAGSERVKKSEVSGQEMKEAQCINKSLSALGDVMEAIDKKSRHIPYRNSKLTFLLQDVVGKDSNSKTLMIVTVCPTIDCVNESTHSLQFASRVRKVNVGRNRIDRKQNTLTSEQVIINSLKKKTEEEKLQLKDMIKVANKKKRKAEEALNQSKNELKREAAKALGSRTKALEGRNELLTAQIENLKKSNAELSAQFRAEKELKRKEGEEKENSVRQLRQLKAKSSLFLKQQGNFETQLQEKETEIKRLRKMISEARRRSVATLIPRTSRSNNLKIKDPADLPRSKKDVSNNSSPDSNQENNNAYRYNSSNTISEDRTKSYLKRGSKDGIVNSQRWK